MTENQKTLSIIGGGLSGLLTAFYLISERKSRSLTLPKINLFVSDLYPACTLSSTATVALRGTKKGLSPLGDQLVDGFLEVESFINTLAPQGVYEGVLTTFNHPMSKSFEKTTNRYQNQPVLKETHGYVCYKEKVFLFSPFHFTAWLYKHLLTSVNFVNDTVTKVESGVIITLSGKTFATDYLVYAAGAFNPLLCENEKVNKSQPVAGTYLEFSADMGDASFCQTYNELNCLYLHQEKKLLFGSASQEGFCFAPATGLLQERYEEWQSAHLTRLPPMADAKMKTGIREKGRKREPYCLSVNKEKTSWAIGGMYKNGYSLAFLLAKKLAQNLGQQMH